MPRYKKKPKQEPDQQRPTLPNVRIPKPSAHTDALQSMCMGTKPSE